MSDGNTIEWTKPSGQKITTNALPATMKYCVSLDWKTAEMIEAAAEKEAADAKAAADAAKAKKAAK